MPQRYTCVRLWNATTFNLSYKKISTRISTHISTFKKSSKCIQDPASNAAKEDKRKPLKNLPLICLRKITHCNVSVYKVGAGKPCYNVHLQNSVTNK